MLAQGIQDCSKIDHHLPASKTELHRCLSAAVLIDGHHNCVKLEEKQPHLLLCIPGKTLAENLETVPNLKEGQEVIMPIDKPIKESGHLQVF